MRKSDFDTWYEKFKPNENERGELILYETYDEDLEKVCKTDSKYIWTLIDSDGDLYISPGRHWVNRLNYFICNNPHNGDKQRDYKY